MTKLNIIVHNNNVTGVEEIHIVLDPAKYEIDQQGIETSIPVESDANSYRICNTIIESLEKD